VAPATPPVEATGVPGLDWVLGGGLRRGALALVVGPPGSGKTMLVSQMAFAAAATGRRSLILTVLSEPVSKLLQHLRGLRFFDETLVGDRVLVYSLQQFLTQGLSGAGNEVVATAREARARLVVIDGFSGLRDADGSPQAVREFLYELGTKLGIQGMTTVIATEGQARDPGFYRMATTADVVVGLDADLDNVRARRWLEVLKVRGAAPRTGLHGLTLDASGAAVHPRLEARVTVAVRDAANETEETSRTGGTDERARFGVPVLDALLHGGLTQESATLVVGTLGTGKTLLGLHFALAGVEAGEPVLFLGFRETPRELLHKADAFDLGRQLRAATAPGGGLTLVRRAPVELNAEVAADELLAELDRTKARRLVVDSTAELERAVSEGSSPARVPNYLAALAEALQLRGVTALFIKEVGAMITPELALPADLTAVVAENVIALHQVPSGDRLRRVLSLPKMRLSAHDAALHEFTIEPPAGIKVLGPFESGYGVFADLAGQRATAGERPSPTTEGGTRGDAVPAGPTAPSTVQEAATGTGSAIE